MSSVLGALRPDSLVDHCSNDVLAPEVRHVVEYMSFEPSKICVPGSFESPR